MRLQTLIEEMYHAYVELQCRTTRPYTGFSVKKGTPYFTLTLEWEEAGKTVSNSFSIAPEYLIELVKNKEQHILYYRVFAHFEKEEEDHEEKEEDA